MMCPLMSRLQPASPGPATVADQSVSSECWPVSAAGDGMLPSLLTSLSPDHLSVLTCERASRQLTGKRHLNIETFFSSDILK